MNWLLCLSSAFVVPIGCCGCQTPSGTSSFDSRVYNACRRAVHDEREAMIQELESRQDVRERQLHERWLEN